MKLGFIGLGRMGFHMVERLLKHNLKVVAYNRSPEKTRQISKKGAIPASSVEELVSKLSGRKIVWVMLPAGKVTDAMIKKVLPLLNKGDILVDGANDFYENAEKHNKWCKRYGVHFFDCGVSGGVWGLKNGYTLMVGGPKNQFKHIEPFVKALSAKGGYGHFGDVGAGHFVKSVHNIIEYVYLQGLAEGTELLNNFKQPIDMVKATSVWRPASVINSWLLDLENTALKRPDFKKISPKIGSVTIEELKKTAKAVKGYVPAFETAVKIREDKSKKFILGKRTIAAIRREFGGHAVKKNG
jgi:6-phosphogluconate dehydrogenase|tara:strand:- start:2258 stop:3151 length:894 start_codon:yes stop_codon:yes gene_type:complete